MPDLGLLFDKSLLITIGRFHLQTPRRLGPMYDLHQADQLRVRHLILWLDVVLCGDLDQDMTGMP